jgi:predicted enzyme related to lactoylglutathione lyase
MNPHKIVFYSADVEAEKDRVESTGAKMGPVRKFGELVLCDGEDPEGHVFQLCNRP